jgi:hypothetical protein
MVPVIQFRESALAVVFFGRKVLLRQPLVETRGLNSLNVEVYDLLVRKVPLKGEVLGRQGWQVTAGIDVDFTRQAKLRLKLL